MHANTTVAIVNTGLILLTAGSVGMGLYFTGSLYSFWAILILVFFMSSENTKETRLKKPDSEQAK